MASVLYIADPVVTEEILSRQHQGQEEVCVDPRSVITPTGWDYIRQHRLQVSRGEAEPPPPEPPPPEASLTPEIAIQEILPAVADENRLVQEGRCDYPEQPCGCRTEEFGSGFVEPSSGPDRPVHQSPPGESGADSEGNNSHEIVRDTVSGDRAADLEALVQRITDAVMERLGE